MEIVIVSAMVIIGLLAFYGFIRLCWASPTLGLMISLMLSSCN